MGAAMLIDAFQDSDTGFPIRYRFDGNIFNLRRLQAKTKVQTDVLDELLYADDMDKNASSEAKMQRAMDQVSQSCDNYYLTIRTKKTEVVHQPASGKPYNEPTITVNGQKLKVVDKFSNLGSTLSRAVHIDDEVTARTAKVSVAFGRLRANAWERNGIKLDTEVLKKAGMQSMHTVLKLAQLRWTGQVIRMPDERLKKSLLWRTTRGKALSVWPEETLQRHPQSLSEGFRHTNLVLGTDCSGAIKVARSHLQWSSFL